MNFYGTSSNGKTPVMTAELLEGRGITRIDNQPNRLLTHKCKIYKGLYTYWLSEKAFAKLKETTNLERACI